MNRDALICSSLTGYTYSHCRQAIAHTGMAEIRMDTMALTLEQVEGLFGAAPVPLIATYRAGKTSDTQRALFLIAAIHAGAAFIDLAFDDPCRRRLMQEARAHGCSVILSYHNFECTPPAETLHGIMRQMAEYAPDILKIVPLARLPIDCLRVLALYAEGYRLLAFCMGAAGRYSRIASALLGAPFVYAAPDNGQPAADGQFTVSQVRLLLSHCAP
ncbi:MAG: type I 3-dehydroquinate dehydratase [Prevotellaceae bacterium]|jgi:3-dehydroquinate dehydratase type I|nr:type I 3-dehydroquinate dehydratase [Prevotellaceae bacterium]